MHMTLPELVQLYAPLAGLLGVFFWLGMLTERVKRLATDVNVLEVRHDDDDGPVKFARLEGTLNALEGHISALDRNYDGIRREMAALWPRGSVVELPSSRPEPAKRGQPK